MQPSPLFSPNEQVGPGLFERIAIGIERHNELQQELVDIFRAGQEAQANQINAGLQAIEDKMKEEISKAVCSRGRKGR